MRGEILDVSGDGAGLVSGDDGQRYRFAARDVSGFVPFRGDRIDFVPLDGVAAEIVLLSSGPLPAREAFGYQSGKDTAPTSPWGYFVRCMTKYIDGNGRGQRSEYWWFILFRTLIVGGPILLGGLLSAAGPDSALSVVGGLFAIIGGLAFLGTIPPQFTATIRRLHDIGLTGWLMLLNLVPYVGGLVILVMTLLPSQPRSNEFGPVPGQTARDRAEVFA